MSGRYLIRPKADEDLEEQAFYLAQKASLETGHRFLMAAHETFGLLASHPGIGWPARLRNPELSALRVFRVSNFPKILVFYLPASGGIEILRVVHGARNLAAFINQEKLK